MTTSLPVMPNGELLPQFNQSIAWFLHSNLCDIPNIKVFYPFWQSRELLDQLMADHQPGDRYVLNYCNEVYAHSSGGDSSSHSVHNRIERAHETFRYWADKYHIPVEHMLFLGNVYQCCNEQSQLAHGLGLADRMLLIDYYELQTYFFHAHLGCDHNKAYSLSASKNFKYMFGKTAKHERVIMAHLLQQAGLLTNSVVSCILESQYIGQVAQHTSEMYCQWLKQDVPADDIELLLSDMAGSPDNVRFSYFVDADGNPTNHCPGYPYDHTLFSDTRVSIIPETYYFATHAKFVTEKTYKAIHNHHPFVLMAAPGMLTQLQHRGYCTFHSVCDESYDVCSNDRKRLGLIVSAAQQLADCTDRAVLTEITAHNHNQLISNAHSTVQDLNRSIGQFLT